MLDREFYEWFRPRPGRCSTCLHHVVEITEQDDFDCHCEIEEWERPGWSPGMHLDHCAFPARSQEDGCPVWVLAEVPDEDPSQG